MGGSVTVPIKTNPVCLEVCNPPIGTFSGLEDSGMTKKKSRFQPSAVRVSRLVCHQFTKGFFTKPLEQWWIFKLIVIFCTCFLGCTCFYLFTLVFVVSFALVFVRNFVIYNHISITIIISIVFITTLFLLHMCASIFVGNVYTIKVILICPQTLLFRIQDMKVLCILCNVLVQVMILFPKLHGYFLHLIACSALFLYFNWQSFCHIHKY